MTVYTNLLSMGYTDEDIRAAADANLNPRTFGVAVQDTEDGPIVGIKYYGDYRWEEENGGPVLAEALTGKDRWHPFILKGREAHFAQFSDVPGGSLVLSVKPMVKPLTWGEPIAEAESTWGNILERGEYATFWESAVSWAQGLESAHSLSYRKVSELREMLADGGKGLKKAELVEQVFATQTPVHANRWPGWFHYGDVLILRADAGLVSDVLTLLHVASLEGTLGIGGGGFGPFASGLSLYDAADIGPEFHRALWKQIKAEKRSARRERWARRRAAFGKADFLAPGGGLR